MTIPDKADKTSNSEKEPTPIEFVTGVRELFRETKKFIIFIRNTRNLNAALVVLTFALALAAFTQAIIYGLQIRPLQQSAEAATSAGETAAKQLELDERPWVDADIKINGPLTFDVNGAHFPLLITLRNSGRTPARILSIDFRILLFGDVINPQRPRNTLCDEDKNITGNRATLFPNTTRPESFDGMITKYAIDREMPFFPLYKDSFVNPTLVACFVYRPTFNNTSLYWTSYNMYIAKFNPATKAETGIFKNGETIDAAHLVVRLVPLSPVDAR